MCTLGIRNWPQTKLQRVHVDFLKALHFRGKKRFLQKLSCDMAFILHATISEERFQNRIYFFTTG